MINSQTLSVISAILQKISSDDVPKSWWIEFSTWRDFKALLRTGSMLSIHRVVKYMTENLENVHGLVLCARRNIGKPPLNHWTP